MESKQADAADLLWGAQAIGAVINLEEQQTLGLLAQGFLPAKKVGRKWVASRQKILAAVLGEATS